MKNIAVAGFLFVALQQITSGAPTVEEILSETPKEIIGQWRTTQNFYFTPWTVLSIDGIGTQGTVTYYTDVRGLSVMEDEDFLVTEGYFGWDTNVSFGSKFFPTAKFILETKPNSIEGGTWEFEFHRELVGRFDVAVWRWTQEDRNEANSLPQLLSKAVSLNRKITRYNRLGKKRRIKSLLKRQFFALSQAAPH